MKRKKNRLIHKEIIQIETLLNQKTFARVAVIKHLLKSIPYDKKFKI
ncbi:hypothetical protein [Lutibacter sp.]|nr:hypothetical protein [Lutibacter sp.]